MRLFRWLATSPVPQPYDLRRCGWRLVPSGERAGERVGEPVPVLGLLTGIAGDDWLALLGRGQPDARRHTLLIGANDAQERAHLLRLGYGEALPSEVSLAELEARTMRMAENVCTMPRHMEVGALKLDLFARDAFMQGRALGLHPREFALLWRLAEIPGHAFRKHELVSEVWRLVHVPETNSLAVHVSRLRRKLALAGFEGAVETTPAGAYRLTLCQGQGQGRPPPLRLPGWQSADEALARIPA